MIRDQRHMSGDAHRETPEQVRAFWSQVAEKRARAGHPRWPLAPNRAELHTSKTHVVAFVSEGRWVADCAGGPHGDCRGGMACWPEHPLSCCLDCGTVYSTDFPDADEIEAGTAALELRPTVNRNWRIDQGETAADVRQENIEHGYPIAAPVDWRDRVAAATGASRELVEAVARKLAA